MIVGFFSGAIAILLAFVHTATPFSLTRTIQISSILALYSPRSNIRLIRQQEHFLQFLFGDQRCRVGQTTALFSNNDPEEKTSKNNGTGGATGAHPMRQAFHEDEKFEIEDEEASTMAEGEQGYFDESPQDKIIRLRSGRLTSLEKKAFLESTLKGSRSLRTPVVRRRDSTSPGDRSVLLLGKNAKVVRENEEYVSRVLDPSRFGLQLARQQTANTSIDDVNATVPTTRPVQETTQSPFQPDTPLKKYFSASQSAQQQSSTEDPPNDGRNDLYMAAGTVQSEKVRSRTRRTTREATIGDALRRDGFSREQEEKSKRWGIDIDKIKVSDS